MVLQVVPPRVHSQAILAAQDIRGHHLAELPHLKTLSQVMQVAPVVYRPKGFPLATLLRAGQRLAQPRRNPPYVRPCQYRDLAQAFIPLGADGVAMKQSLTGPLQLVPSRSCDPPPYS